MLRKFKVHKAPIFPSSLSLAQKPHRPIAIEYIISDENAKKTKPMCANYPCKFEFNQSIKQVERKI